MSLFPSSRSTAAAAQSSSAAGGDVSRDVEVANPPPDSISAMEFSPTADILAVSSWDNGVRGYEILADGTARGKFIYKHDQPAMSVCWNKDGTKVISGSADKTVKMYDVASGQPIQIGTHDDAVKSVRWVDAPTGGIVASASWDKTIKYWDPRQQAPVANANLGTKCYSMDVQYPLLIVGTSDLKVHVFNLSQNPGTATKSMKSPLKHQTRVVTCFPTADGYALGSVEGRVAIQSLKEDLPANSNINYTFRCHRKDIPGQKDVSTVYAVNDIHFHLPGQGTFATAGSDGTFTFWHKDARSRLKSFDIGPHSIPATAFSRSGNIFAYAVSYDWSKGHIGNVSGHPNKIMLHPIKEDEVKKRPTLAKT